MEFTGERFTPDCVREIWYEHWHRYVVAASMVTGQRVLDLACGEGYGSDLLAGSAAEVVGVDLSADAISHARARYQRPNLTFKQGEAVAIPTPDRSFDIIVSFETIEHLQQQEQMLAEFRRVLRLDGFLIVSSPDKKTYSEDAGFDNPFHVRELFRDELITLLSAQFPVVRLFAQKLVFQSLIWDLQDSEKHDYSAALLDRERGVLTPSLDYPPLYYIALCAATQSALPSDLPSVFLFGDREESVYSHYNGEIRKNMAAGGLLAERDREIERLRGELQRVQEASRPWWRRFSVKRR